MAVEATVGHTITSTILYLDANGNPMLTKPVPDAPPTWTQSTPATDTLSVSADGSTATDVGVAAGSDTLSLALMVGGVQFAATQQITIDAAPQVLTSVAIASVVS